MREPEQHEDEPAALSRRIADGTMVGVGQDDSSEEELVKVLPPCPPPAVAPVEEATPVCDPTFVVPTGDMLTPMIPDSVLETWGANDRDRHEPEAEECIAGPEVACDATVSRTRSRTPTRGCGDAAGLIDAG